MNRLRCSLVLFIAAKIVTIIDLCMKILTSWEMNCVNRLYSFQTRLGFGTIPVFNRCTGITPIADWPSRFLTLNTGYLFR